jgi:lipoprotein NlpI
MLARMDAAQLAQWALGRYDRRHPGLQLEAPPQVLHDPQLNRLSVIARYRVPRAVSEAEGSWTLRFFASNLQGAFVIPESLARAMPLAVPSFPGVMRYQVEVQWPESVCIVAEPGTERLDTPHFALQVTRSFRANLAREMVVLQPTVAAVPAGEVLRLVEDMRRIDQLVQGQFVVSADDVQAAPQALQQRLAAQLRAQAERAGRAVARGHLQGEDLAAAHCLRAEALAELGEGEAALHDAQAAVAVAPALARAWSCRGKVMWALGRFAEAEADFGRALQLDGDAHAGYLQRGQARFYEGRLEPAAQDFERAARLAADEPQRWHAMVWQGWALKRLGRALPEVLQEAAQHGSVAWPQPALGLIAGTLKPDQLLAEAGKAEGDARALALVEAWFALGQHHLAQGQVQQARDAFEKTREAGVTRYAEHAAAGFELQRLDGGAR